MFRSSITAFAILMILLSLGCANNDPIKTPRGIQSEFKTSTAANNLKLFSLKVAQAHGRPPHRQQQDDKQLKLLEKWMDQELQQQLSINNYCETGFTEIERSIGNGFSIIRGECNALNNTQ